MDGCIIEEAVRVRRDCNGRVWYDRKYRGRSLKIARGTSLGYLDEGATARVI